jgi:hypothetical protein
MKTDRLIEALAHDTGATPRHVAERRLMLAGVAGLAVAFAMRMPKTASTVTMTTETSPRPPNKT